jgi:deazaflavin-dependent oxidoreductase (nitroreductase family)
MGWFAVDGPVGRAMRTMATSSTFRKVGPKVVPPVDRARHRVTGGRVVLSRVLVPSLVLTTIGRKSGQARETPLACVPDETGGWWVVGSNFGREQHPAWTGNLIAHPEATVSFAATLTAVRAELLDDDAKAAVWPRLVAAWPAYDDYVESSGRNIRVFHLVPVAG